MAIFMALAERIKNPGSEEQKNLELDKCPVR